MYFTNTLIIIIIIIWQAKIVFLKLHYNFSKFEIWCIFYFKDDLNICYRETVMWWQESRNIYMNEGHVIFNTNETSW